jgi:hypothetical protein
MVFGYSRRLTRIPTKISFPQKPVPEVWYLSVPEASSRNLACQIETGNGVSGRQLGIGLKKMDYQLTLKFPYYDVADYKNILALEDKLVQKLDRSVRVDGHYAGSEIMNIFIITSQPLETFVVVLEVVRGEGLLASLSVMCKAVSGHTCARLWPLDIQQTISTP